VEDNHEDHQQVFQEVPTSHWKVTIPAFLATTYITIRISRPKRIWTAASPDEQKNQ